MNYFNLFIIGFSCAPGSARAYKQKKKDDSLFCLGFVVFL